MVSSVVSQHVLLLLAISLGLIFISSWRVHNIISNDYNLGERIIKSYTTNKTSCHGCHRSIRTNNDALFTKGEKKACTSTIQQWNVNENNFHNPNNNNDHRLDIDRSLAHFVSRKNSYGNKADFSALERLITFFHDLGHDGEDSTILLGGMNEGQLSERILGSMPNISFYGFEIQEKYYNNAIERLSPFPHVHAVNMGLGDVRKSNIPIGGPEGPHAGLYNPKGQWGWTVQRGGRGVDTIPLADFAIQHGITNATYVVIDTEGYEPKVIRGMRLSSTTHQRRFPLFQFELGGTWAARDARHNNDVWTQKDVVQALDDWGYETFLIGEDDWLQVDARFFEQVNNPGMDDDGFGKFIQGNLLVMHRNYTDPGLRARVLGCTTVFRGGFADSFPGRAPPNNHRMSVTEQALAFSNVGAPNSGLCSKFETFGQGDEAKEICIDHLPTDTRCLVFSIGSNNLWGFERDLFLRTQCRIHTFDCTGNWSVPADLASRVTFHHKCIWGEEGVGAFDDNDHMLWTDLVALAGGRTPQYLKMDVEGWEWVVLHQVLQSKQRPAQIGFELHLETRHEITSSLWVRIRGEEPPLYIVPERGRRIRELITEIGERGYALTRRSDNIYCAHCSELVIQLADRFIAYRKGLLI